MTTYRGIPARTSVLAAIEHNKSVMAKPRAKRQSPEYHEQQAVIALYQSIGASVYVNSVYGAQPHGVTPGIADLRIKHTDWRLEWEHETKPAKRRQSKAQHDYMRECQAMGTVYVLGGVSEALDFLDFLGIVKQRLADTAVFFPRAEWEATIGLRAFNWPFYVKNWYNTGWFARQRDTFGYLPPRARRVASAQHP